MAIKVQVNNKKIVESNPDYMGLYSHFGHGEIVGICQFSSGMHQAIVIDGNSLVGNYAFNRWDSFVSASAKDIEDHLLQIGFEKLPLGTEVVITII